MSGHGNAREVVAHMSRREGDEIALAVLRLVRGLVQDHKEAISLRESTEPTGVFVEADVREFVMRRSA